MTSLFLFQLLSRRNSKEWLNNDDVIGSNCKDAWTTKTSLRAIFLLSFLLISASNSLTMAFSRKHWPPAFQISFMYLGVIFDSKDTWKLHSCLVTPKCNKIIHFMRTINRSKWGAELDAFILIFKSKDR